MTDKNKILEKIKKIMALSSSSNEAEAALALEKAQELMAQYGLSETLYARAEFELALQNCDDPVEKARRFIVRQRQSFGGHGRRWSYCVADSCGGVASAVKRWQTGIKIRPLHLRYQRQKSTAPVVPVSSIPKR